tara:strand:+ start:103694 stop:104947 length:1254 start_codon:yes stop_codon:yes gene_type:complete
MLFSEATASAQSAKSRTVHVQSYLPAGYVLDGSISYQKEIQQAIDAAGKNSEVVFEPMSYLIDAPEGLRVHSNQTFRMDGARFLMDESCDRDGQLFYAENVSDLRWQGGTIVGRNDAWDEGVNIRGIHLVGECHRIRVKDMHIRDLSSNGVGIFATDAEHAATDVWVTDTVIENCSNHYGDYRAAPPQRRGPERGSSREDQGLVAFYHVHDFQIRGCRLEKSRSDGTHFYFCRNGQFCDNRVYRAQMGGYFLESCNHVLAANNVIRDNGSRGVTIERGSQFCTLSGNTIAGSGREGIWAPDSISCVFSGNILSLNGRKVNGDERHTLWNANVTINQARGDKLDTPTAHYVIANNLIETDAHQIAAIRVDTRTPTRDIVIHGNLFLGTNRKILIEGPKPDVVAIEQNRGSEQVFDDRP